jgi:hypothetical protein
VISIQTGLGALTRAANDWKKPIAILPQKVLVPCDYCSSDSCSKPFSYTKFLKGQSWNGWDTYFMNAIGCHPEMIVMISAALILFLAFRKK